MKKKPVTPGDGSAGRVLTNGAESVRKPVLDWRSGAVKEVSDNIIRESAVALVYNGISHVVMMTTPTHLEDFALGFSLTEGILSSPDQLYDVEIQERRDGIEVSMEISSERFAVLKSARRNLTGRTGCGLCGAESLEQAIRRPEPVSTRQTFSHDGIEHAVRWLEENQPLQSITGAVHGAAWCDNQGNIDLVREDVGRHNALDKLCGALARRASGAGGSGHFVLISSRASYEMVVKAACMGVEMLVAVSAPTQLAVELAAKLNITLVGFARPGRHMVYTCPSRLQ